MANANRISGLSPVRTINGAPWNQQATMYSVAAGYNTALAVGDPVISSGTADAQGVQGVVLAADTGPIRGVIVGIGPKYAAIAGGGNLDITYRPASDPAEWWAMVVDDPNTIFEVQDSGSTPITMAQIGLNTNLVLGANNGFQSGWSVNGTGSAVTAALQVRLLGLVQRADNVPGLNQKVLVKINNHEYAAGAAGL